MLRITERVFKLTLSYGVHMENVPVGPKFSHLNWGIIRSKTCAFVIILFSSFLLNLNLKNHFWKIN